MALVVVVVVCNDLMKGKYMAIRSIAEDRKEGHLGQRLIRSHTPASQQIT